MKLPFEWIYQNSCQRKNIITIRDGDKGNSNAWRPPDTHISDLCFGNRFGYFQISISPNDTLSLRIAGVLDTMFHAINRKGGLLKNINRQKRQKQNTKHKIQKHTMMKTFSSILFLSLLSLGKASLSFVPHHKLVMPMHHSIAISPRGGAGPLDPELTSQVTIAPVLATGVGCTFMPELTCDIYGYDGSKPLTRNIMRGVGIYITETATLLSLLLFQKDLTRLQCVGYTYAAATLQGLFNTYKAKCDGFDIGGNLVACAMGVGTYL